MIGADLTQRVLTVGQYDIAKPALIEKRTAFLRPLQNKMRRVSRKIDVGSHAITDLTGKRAVALGGLIINVNFPTDTAAVAALVLGWDAAVTMVCLSDDGENTEPTEDEQAFFALRDSLIAVLQNREQPLDMRIDKMLSVVGGVRFDDMRPWAEFLSGLEILDPVWTAALETVGDEREVLPGHTGEQLMVYLLMRHLPKMLDGEDPATLASFAVLGYDLICALYASSPEHDFVSLCELVRLFSSEIEYSEENLYAVFDEIASSCP